MKEKLLFKIFELQNFFLRKKNFNKPKVFVYTDSRGFNFKPKGGKTPFGSYVGKLSLDYNLTYRICPERHTTIVDFMQYSAKASLSNFDVVILHCGVVDFSPRPVSNIEKVLAGKINNPVFNALKQENKTHYENASHLLYNNEKTTTLYSEKYFISRVIPALSSIQNLVWINSNHFVTGWDGNYKNGRPMNIDETVDSYDKLLSERLPHIISLKNWDNGEIKKYTIDNIHFSREGFDILYKTIKNKIEELTKN